MCQSLSFICLISTLFFHFIFTLSPFFSRIFVVKYFCGACSFIFLKERPHFAPTRWNQFYISLFLVPYKRKFFEISDADTQNLYFSLFYHEFMLCQCLSHVYKFWLCVISPFLFIICICSYISVNYNRLSFGLIHLVHFFSWKSAVRIRSVNNNKCL